MTEQLQGQTGALVSANEQLEARRSFIEAVLSGITSAVVSVDADHRILLVNAARSEERRVGKGVSVRVDLGGRRIIKKKNSQQTYGTRRDIVKQRRNKVRTTTATV